MSAENPLSSRQRDDLAVIAAMMIPASSQYDVPGADDAAIQADIVATLGRDVAVVAQALDHLANLAGRPLAELDAMRARGDRKGISRDRRRRGGNARASCAAVLLSRRPRCALAGP